MESDEHVRQDNAVSVAHRALPPIPPHINIEETATLVLFYQYVEPSWSPSEHKKSLSKIISIANIHHVTGRGRCAPEGLNCTLTGTPAGVRAFCEALRSWNPLFNETDFKLTDGLELSQKFKALTLRKVDELVGYGLAGERAPALNESKALHLEADQYHEAMKDKNTVIIDVRNYYESSIGHFNPPENGAELIDPKIRNSHEFPRWLNMPETQQKLQGKKVRLLLYELSLREKSTLGQFANPHRHRF